MAECLEEEDTVVQTSVQGTPTPSHPHAQVVGMAEPEIGSV